MPWQRDRKGAHRGDLGAADYPLTHPANEGHDEERARDRLEKWASEESEGGPDARALADLQARERAAGLSPEEVLPLEPPTPPPPRGSPYNADENRREHHTRGGEAKKHPKRPEDTTPEPGRGAHHARTVTGENPDVRPTAGGVEYQPGEQPTVGRKGRGS